MSISKRLRLVFSLLSPRSFLEECFSIRNLCGRVSQLPLGENFINISVLIIRASNFFFNCASSHEIGLKYFQLIIRDASNYYFDRVHQFLFHFLLLLIDDTMRKFNFTNAFRVFIIASLGPNLIHLWRNGHKRTCCRLV